MSSIILYAGLAAAVAAALAVFDIWPSAAKPGQQLKRPAKAPVEVNPFRRKGDFGKR